MKSLIQRSLSCLTTLMFSLIGMLGAQPKSVEEVFCLDFDALGYGIGSIQSAVAFGDGRILVADAAKGALLHITSPGSPVQHVSLTHEKKKVSVAPYLLTKTADGDVAVFDRSRARVIVFDPEHLSVLWIREIGTQLWNPKGFAVFPDGRILLTGGIHDNSFGVHLFGVSGKLVRSWYRNVETELPNTALKIAGGPVALIDDQRVVFSNASPHEIGYIDTETPTFSTIAADSTLVPSIGDDFIEIEEVGQRRILRNRWDFLRSTAVFFLDDGTILNVVTDAGNGESTWESYSADGTLIGRLKVPQPYHPHSLDPGTNRVLASAVDVESQELSLVKLSLIF